MNAIADNNNILQFALKNNIINIDDVREQVMRKRNETYLKQHEEKHKIWFNESTQQWMTYIDDPTSTRGFTLKRRKEKSDLENLIIAHYKAIENTPYIRDVFYEWLDLKLEFNEITPQTYTRYENVFLRHFTNDPISLKYISEITTLDLEMFIKRSIKNYELDKKGYGKLKTIIKGVFKYAKKKSVSTITMSIFFEELDLPKNIFKAKEKKADNDEVYLENEVQLLKDFLLTNNTLRYLGVLLVFVSGLRVGELATLKPSDIVLNDNYGKLYVRRTEVHYSQRNANNKRKNVVAVQEFPKTDAGNRCVLLNSFAVSVLNRILELNPTPTEYLFEENGKRIKIRGFSGALERACEHLDIKYRPMHKIRKTYGTTLIDNNVSEALIASQMGHTDIATTKQHYYRNNQIEEHKIVEIEKALSVI